MSKKRDRDTETSSSCSSGSSYYTGPVNEIKKVMASLLKKDEEWKEKGRKGKRPLTWEKMKNCIKQYDARKRYRCIAAYVNLRHIERQKLRQAKGTLDQDYITDPGSDADYCSEIGSVELDSNYSDQTAVELADGMEQDGEDEYCMHRITKESTFDELRDWMRKICEPHAEKMIKPAMRDIPLE
jgi:hypothetical protein